MLVAHIAGPDIRVDNLLRQRCAWCGELLIDYDLERIAVPQGCDPAPSVWTVGKLVAVDGGASWELPESDKLPDESCAGPALSTS